MIDIYLNDSSSLKSIGMVKQVDFDYAGYVRVRASVYSYERACTCTSERLRVRASVYEYERVCTCTSERASVRACRSTSERVRVRACTCTARASVCVYERACTCTSAFSCIMPASIGSCTVPIMWSQPLLLWGLSNPRRFRELVRREVRRQGWRRHLSLSYAKRQYTVRVHADNCLQTVWNNPCLTCLLCVLPLGIP